MDVCKLNLQAKTAVSSYCCKSVHEHFVVFFILAASENDSMEVCVVKFGTTRLAMQGEQFANELTRHLGIPAPRCRMIRKSVRACISTDLAAPLQKF